MILEIEVENSRREKIKFAPREKFILEKVDWGFAEISVGTIYYFPSWLSDEYLYHEWKERNVIINGVVIGDSEAEIEELKQKLNNFFRVQSLQKLLYKGYYLEFYVTALPKFGISAQDDNEVLRRFQINGVCTNVTWRSQFDILQDANATVGNFKFPLIVGQEVRGKQEVMFGEVLSDDTIVIEYDGELSRGCIFTIFSVGSMSNISVQCMNGSVEQTLNVNRTFVANTELIIDTRDGFMNAKANGVDITRTVTGEWIRLLQGLNIFSISYEAVEQVNFLINVKNDELFEVQV